MYLFNSVFGKVFEIIFLPFRSMSPWVGMIMISCLTSLLMLLIFRLTSNQQGIRKVKNTIKAHLLELRLYKDSMSLSLNAQKKILLANLKYMSYSAKPMLVMIIPLLLILFQLNLWFAYEALTPGKKSILSVKLKENYNPLKVDISIEPVPGIVVDSPALRIEEENEINWRFIVDKKSIHDLGVLVDGKKITKKVAVATKPLSKISPLKTQHNFIDEMLNPGEAPLPGDSPIKYVQIAHPAKSMNLFGWHMHWIIIYIVLSILFGFALKGVFKVEI